MRRRVEPYVEAVHVMTQTNNPKVLRSLAPSGVRGLILQRGKQGVPTTMPSHNRVYFDWTYPNDHPEMRRLYTRAKQQQWNGDDLPWHIDVDPENPEKPIIPREFLEYESLGCLGIQLTGLEERRLNASVASWMLSQFLHGEQGALFAAAQVTEAVPFFDGKLFGSTQVVDEGRHVEVFHRYLDSKMNKDVKFLGMQIMVEGLALGAFGTLYRMTAEPMLKALLKKVIQDEARHVHYGVLALRDHFRNELSESERREREDWAFEVALLMRNRFLMFEVYEEWFEHKLTRKQWARFVTDSPGFSMFRHEMFRRLVPNLREIGLLSDRIKPHYQRAGLMQYYDDVSATQLSSDQMLSELDAP
ncbi:MAG: ferritin-like domain-containing protein [Deltaproteobacteria bacterium]|nr:ferritin-like domain-containing protein [Deltaproteobacteria bacterium]